MDYSKRIREFRVKSNLTQDRLAHIMGLETPNFISQIETGKKKVGLSVVTKFCNAMGIELADFFRDSSRQIDDFGSIPVIDLMGARVDKLFDGECHMCAEGLCRIPRPPDVLDKNAYGAIVRGESMSPALSSNDVVIVSPAQPYKNNDIAIIGLTNNDILLRKIRTSNGVMVLECCNSSSEPQVINRNEMKFVHPVLWARYNMPLPQPPGKET